MPTPPRPDTGAGVELSDVTKSYGARPALTGLTLRAPLGAVTAVLGRNGAGKSTAVGICAGVLSPDDGMVRVLGLDPVTQGRELRRRVALMPQAGGSGAAGIYPSARVREVLELFAAFAAAPLPVDGLLDRLDLHRVSGTPWRRLSGGEQQRLSLALAIVGRPELVFLDEPSAGLDVHARREAWSLIGELRDAGVTVVLTTHAMDEAERLADHVVVVEAGRAVAAGAVGELAAAEPGLAFEAEPGLPVEQLAGAVGRGTTVRETTPGHYVVDGTTDAASVAAVTAWCAERGVLLARVETRRRSLEDVFLELTGGRP